MTRAGLVRTHFRAGPANSTLATQGVRQMDVAPGPAGRHRSVARWRAGVLLTLPSFLFVFAFLVYPIADMIRVSFYDYSPLRSSTAPFVGLRNYGWMLSSDTVRHSLAVTLAFTVSSVALETVIGVLAALLLSKLILDGRNRWARFLSGTANGIFILPFAAPGIVAAIAWKMLLHPQFSPINALLGIQVAWFTDFPLASHRRG